MGTLLLGVDTVRGCRIGRGVVESEPGGASGSLRHHVPTAWRRGGGSVFERPTPSRQSDGFFVR